VGGPDGATAHVPLSLAVHASCGVEHLLGGRIPPLFKCPRRGRLGDRGSILPRRVPVALETCYGGSWASSLRRWHEADHGLPPFVGRRGGVTQSPAYSRAFVCCVGGRHFLSLRGRGCVYSRPVRRGSTGLSRDRRGLHSAVDAIWTPTFGTPEAAGRVAPACWLDRHGRRCVFGLRRDARPRHIQLGATARKLNDASCRHYVVRSQPLGFEGGSL